MPNWCNNVACFSHENPEMIAKIANVKENLFAEFFPIPEEQKENWYSYNLENFGTKWDVEPDIIDQEDNSITIVFDSAWSPPIEFYNQMLQLGFEISATYEESGMAFCGMYENGEDNYLDYSDMTPDEIRENYPEFDNEFNLADNLEMWMEDEEDEES
jgi:hypothetical protein